MQRVCAEAGSNSPFRLYESNGYVDFIGRLGGEANAVVHGDGQWVVFPSAVACFAVLDGAAGKSHFERGGRFCWVAEETRGRFFRSASESVPVEVQRSAEDNRPIYLFVRRPEQSEFVFVGYLQSTCEMQGPGPKYHRAWFDLRPVLPSRLWTELEDVDFGELDHNSVDDALACLASPASVEDRVQVLQRLVEYWHGPITSEDGMDADELAKYPVPGMLRWWFTWAGRRENILSGQNLLLKPGEWRPHRGRTIFHIENQYCYAWSIEKTGDDPSVFGGDPNDGRAFEPEGVRLSEHLIQSCLFEAVWRHARYRAVGTLNEETLGRLEATIQPLALAGWNWEGARRFHASNGAFMITMRAESGGCDVVLAAKTEHPLKAIRRIVGDECWKSFDT